MTTVGQFRDTSLERQTILVQVERVEGDPPAVEVFATPVRGGLSTWLAAGPVLAHA